ncbi:hypothetical protein CL652_02515 [bacterium]|nr:hypothetical protein [bacterium]|tara:strand:+ start:1957 stop:3093 length:1137 start_codon:yes stop_codon:yes gene_type:complete
MMKFSDLWSSIEADSFYVGKDDFAALEINDTQIDGFYYFRNARGLVKYFVLDDRQKVQYLAEVSLIKKDGKFTPRITFCVRDKSKKIVEAIDNDKQKLLKARVSFDQCHENFWNLIGYIRSLAEVETPDTSFSLINAEEKEKIQIAEQLPPESIKQILTKAVQDNKIKLDEKEIALLQGRKVTLTEFEKRLKENYCEESWWQEFFENNTWIFGYGLRYVFLSTEQDQPNYGGTTVDGKGGQKGDYLMASNGALRFTSLVEIKTPCTPLLRGTEEIRNGAWSMSKELVDAISQIQANKATWEKEGARQPDNMDKLEYSDGIYTVTPRGIIVIGSLSELADTRSKRESFERFRQSISGVEILTFDELYERACYIVKPDDT